MTGWAAMRLVKKGTILAGQTVQLVNDEDGIIGMIPVYKSAAAAFKAYGSGVQVVEITIHELEEPRP